jgi:ATP-binding cassette subfamily B (MDR/TAP) protein 1
VEMVSVAVADMGAMGKTGAGAAGGSKGEKGKGEKAKGEEETEEREDEGPVDISWIWEMSEPDRAYMVIGLIGSAMVGATFPALGFFVAKMIAVYFILDPVEIRQEASKWALVFIYMGLGQMVGYFLSKYGFGVLTERLAARVRERSFDKMLHLDVAWYDKEGNSPGGLAQSLATDAIAVRALAGESTGTSVSQTVALLVSLGVALSKSWIMTLVMLGMLPIIGLSVTLQASFAQEASGAAAKATNDAGNVASQTLLNIRTNCAFGLEQVSIDRFVSFLVEPMEQSKRKGRVTGAGMGFAQFIILGTTGLQWWVGLHLIQAGRLTFTELLAVILTIMMGAIGMGEKQCADVL